MWFRVFCASSVVAVLTASGAAPVNAIYPVGTRFPLLLYSIHSAEEMEEAGGAGWNVAHRYSFSPSFFEVVESAGWLCVAHLQGKTKAAGQPGEARNVAGVAGDAANLEEAGGTGKRVGTHERLRTEAEAAADIRAYAVHDCVAWWDLPEEQRWWKEQEYQIVRNLSQWTRKYDPQKRPNYMYIPGHYRADGIAKYVRDLDIIGAGTYTEYSHQPRAWVRWRTEETLRGIHKAGFRVGPDYLNGEKTPIGIPMLFNSSLDRMDPISPVGAYHDFWSCIASGAKGIFVFSFWHRRDLPLLRKTWEDGYFRAGKSLMSVPGLDQALLFGEDLPLTVDVIKGSPLTPTFRPYGAEEDIALPAVNVLGKTHEGRLYIVSVSSRERPVTARIGGIPEGIQTLEVHGEERKQGNTVSVAAGTVEDSFPWLTVHLYSADLPH